MNKIYIVDTYFNDKVEVYFNKDIIKYDNIEYKMEFKNNKIKIYWLNDIYEEYIADENSYVFYKNINLKKDIYLIYLLEKDWYDQILVNIKTGMIDSINRNEKGRLIEKTETQYIIEWMSDNNRREIYNIYSDVYIYQKDIEINEYQEYNEEKKDVKIDIFIHICCIENWKDILTEQLNKIYEELYEKTNKIFLCILGNIEWKYFMELLEDTKFEIIYMDKKKYLYEHHTINSIKSYCERLDEERYILYIHTKGVRKMSDGEITKSWREMMQYFLIERHKECIDNLDKYDTLGCNYINDYCVKKENAFVAENHAYHYSGNFWWSKKTYIDKLDYLDLNYSKMADYTRFKAENWILSGYDNNNNKIGIIHQDYTNIHPYYIMIGNDYKKTPFYIKKILE